ncbi:pentapeptide repeat-containing protein [Saccharothrix coeruleofusca]|uniref:pentapeptide repeat-containing protein n=1 Tax=Saccharothrix coeruleofusca TaxID=33919 RepID=UPI0035584D8D
MAAVVASSRRRARRIGELLSGSTGALLPEEVSYEEHAGNGVVLRLPTAGAAECQLGGPGPLSGGRRVVLRRVVLGRAVLRRAVLRRAVLRRAVLRRAVLRRAVLRRAVLRRSRAAERRRTGRRRDAHPRVSPPPAAGSA